MDGLFRFTLDDFINITDEPIGWDTAKIKIKRNFKFGGLFLEYASELEFWGDAFEYINQQIQALGYCFSVKIKIDYQCTTGAAYEEVFTGFINISRATIDNQACTIKANLEQDNVYSDFLKTSDRKIAFSLNSATFPNGNTVVSPWNTINYHNVETGKNTLDDLTDNRAYAMSAFNCLNYLTQMNTQGVLSIVSDFFSVTEPKTNRWTVVLSGATMVSGQTITITFKNIFNQTITKSIDFISTEAATLALLGYECCEITDFGSDYNPASLCNYFWHSAFANAVVDTPRQINFESWIPITIISCEVTGSGTHPTVTIAETQYYQKGGKNLYITTQLNETFNSRIWAFQSLTSTEVSFEQLFNELDALFCLGMQLEGMPGSYKLRIEPIEYFYSQSSQLTIENVLSSTTSFDTERDYKTVDMNSASKMFGSILYGAGFKSVNITSGSNVVTYGSFSPKPNVGDYVLMDSSLEVFRIASIVSSSSFTTTQNAQYTVTNDSAYLGNYQQIQAVLATLNGYQTASIGSCFGESLKLNNEFVTEIEKHGDQTRRTDNSQWKNISAGSDKDRFTFLQCDDSFDTVQYPYIIKQFPGGLANVPQFRWAFNGLLTNHHKIINNAMRIKYDCFSLVPYYALGGGTLVRYPNNAIVKPSRVHEFEHFLSFQDIVNLLQNPAQTIYVELNNDSVFTKCWLNEIEFDINTKKATLKLYESL